MSENDIDELNELLGDREITKEADPTQPDENETPSSTLNTEEDAPLPLTHVTQTKNHRQLLDFFLTADIPDEGINKTEMAKQSGVSANGIRRHIDTFLDYGIVELTTSESAHIKKYTVNRESDVHRALRVANNVLAENYNQQV